MQFYQKDTLTQVLSSEYCEVFKNTYFEKYLQTAASDRVGSYNVKTIRYNRNRIRHTLYNATLANSGLFKVNNKNTRKRFWCF